MKKILLTLPISAMLTTLSTSIISCQSSPDFPYIRNDQISQAAKDKINSLVLDLQSGATQPITSLFDYNLNMWQTPNVVPDKNIINSKVDLASWFPFDLVAKSLVTEQNAVVLKNSLQYLKNNLLSSTDLINQPWDSVINRYNSYLDSEAKSQTVRELSDIVYYFQPDYNENQTESKEKRWLYVDRLRSYNYQDWYNVAHAWNLNPVTEEYDNNNVEYDQGVFYYEIINALLGAIKKTTGINLLAILGPDKGNTIGNNIGTISFTFTVWNPLKWTKYIVDGKPLVESNDNIFENMSIIPLNQELGLKLVVSDVYGAVSNYMICHFNFDFYAQFCPK